MKGEIHLGDCTTAPTTAMIQRCEIKTNDQTSADEQVDREELAGEKVDGMVEAVRERAADYGEAKLQFVRACAAVKVAEQARDRAFEELRKREGLMDDEIAPVAKTEAG